MAIEVPEIYSGSVMQKMGLRHGEMQDMNTDSPRFAGGAGDGVVTMEFIISTKELFGFRSEFITDTKGLGVFNSTFYEFAKDMGNSYVRENGSLIVHEAGVTKLYGLTGIQDRGILFVGAGRTVYKGQVIGKSSRPGDISVNVCKEKAQTNHPSSGERVSDHFNAPKIMDLEDALEYINDDELVEVTPKSVRIRKVNLNAKI